MSWGSLSNFVSMGGYGYYVWGSYLISICLIGAEIFLLIARQRRARFAVEPAQWSD